MLKDLIKSKIIIFTVFILFIISGLILITYNKSLDNYVTVSGTYSETQANQIATFSITVEYENTDKNTAVSAAEKSSSELVALIKNFGIDSEDIETTRVSIYEQDRYYDSSETSKWHASYTVNVTLRDLDKSTDFTALINGVENASVWGPNHSIDNTAIDEGSLLAGAVADAQEKAQKIAESSNRKIGKVISVTEATSSSPIFYSKLDAVAGMGGGAPEGFNLEPGTTETSKTVIVVFKLK